ncbi:MAG: CD225/dispanin family protein [Clostridiales bacterium]|nr:CD225/dispanin family protein [Clostridiales bacterium]
MDYYLASEQGPLGPYSEQQLIGRRLKGEELVWREGLNEWVRADSLPELQDVLRLSSMPPAFNHDRFYAHEGSQVGNGEYGSRPQYQYEYDDDEECPPTYRWLAIIAFLGIVPCAIVAIIKSAMVNRLWDEGNRDGARKQSRQVLLWSLISIVVGLPLTIYFMMNNDMSSGMSNGIMEQFFNF